MKILTLNPPFFKNYSRQSRSPCVAKSGTIYYSYYLAYATGALEQNGFDVTLYDSIAFDSDREQTLNDIREINPDLIITDSSTPSIINDVNFAMEIKKKLPNCHINMVGTFPSKAGYEEIQAINPDPIDSICRGEYEITAVKLANALKKQNSLSSVDGLSYKENGNIIKNTNAILPTTDTLDSLPFVTSVYKKHFGKKGINKHFYASITWPYVHILTARGCPYSCSFCNIPSIASYRTRSIENVVNEFKYIQEELPYVNEIFIEDDTFPVNKNRTLELCERLIDEKVKIRWSCNARVDTNPDVLGTMRKAGARLLCVGFESPNKSALDGVIKKTNKNKQEEFMNSCNKHDLKVNGCFIIGLPGDNDIKIDQTIDFAKKLMPNTAQFYPHMLYPGTGSFKWAEENGYLRTKDWSKWLTKDGMHNTPLELPDLPPERLLMWTNLARRRFYFNYKYIFKMLVQAIRYPKEGIRMFISGKTFFKHLFRYLFRLKERS
uniref:Fe-S oxidoreductase n=1 Tax=uncultured verrucomicrobium HF0500_08N17 TaxID=723597 RepID=E7C4Y3_9BACT|nr:Fe-S oxidoreductase [uncultured verrucomicrobium HF0500_08N17]